MLHNTNNEWNQPERRKYKRFPLTFYVSYIDPETELKQTGVYESYKDVSINGMFFKAKKKLPVGIDIMLNVTIPGFDKVFKIKSKIIRSMLQEDGNCSVGVAFMEMNPAEQQELEEFLKSFEGI